jgi:hypothetical protein
MGSDQHRDPLFTACVRAAAGSQARDNEKGMDQQAEADVAIPGFPSSHFVVVHADLTLRLFKGTLYGPAILADPDQFLDGGYPQGRRPGRKRGHRGRRSYGGPKATGSSPSSPGLQ